MISIKLFHRSLSNSMFNLNRSLMIKSDFSLVNEMKTFNQNDQYRKTLDLYYKNKNNIKFNTSYSSSIISQVLKACGKLRELQIGSIIHSQIESSLINDSFVLASLIHFYIECGEFEKAQALFDSTKNRTLAMIASMIKGYNMHNQADLAMKLFHETKNPDRVVYILFFNSCAQLGSDKALISLKKVVPNISKSYFSNDRFMNALLDAFIKCGDIAKAESLFESVTNKTTEMFGALMKAYIINGEADKVIDLYEQMNILKIRKNEIIYLVVIKALSKIADQSLSQLVTDQIPKDFLRHDRIQKSMIDMWGKSGCVYKAKVIFEKISHRDQFAYATMINTYGLNGLGVDAIELYRQVPPQFIDETINICVLNACAHSGLVDQAKHIFQTIEKKTFKIFTTMIDCLARASCHEEAQKLINQYEYDHPPVLAMHMALLSGARNDKNDHLAQQIFDRMKKLFPESSDVLTAGSTLLANVYGSIGDMKKAGDIQRDLHQSGVKKIVGISWTVTNGKIHRFRAHDQSHPRSLEIHAEVKKISDELLQHGYQYDSSWITRALKQDETIGSVLCGHSERLAIAWNFVVNPKASQIQVTKNLRVCGDCHQATKLIAAIRQCDIIVRDANRIHHFHKNGQCSCNDYF